MVRDQDAARDGEIRARDYTDSSIRQLKATIDEELREHYVSYRGLWNEWWKLAGIALTAAGVGAALAIAAANLT